MEPNTLLDALLDEAGMSRVGLAARVNHAGAARGKSMRYDHSSVIRWLKGQRPRGTVPDVIATVLSHRLGRTVSLDDIGMGTAAPAASSPLDGFVGRAIALWRGDEQQRDDLQNATVITGLPAVGPVWEWENPPDDMDVSSRGTIQVGLQDVDALRAARPLRADVPEDGWCRDTRSRPKLPGHRGRTPVAGQLLGCDRP
ncbi:hypothetical protein Sm713_61240 [Streptomyces sp. TS71-3]|nr:hypothetical protein Sm713_61240 [Streptomyces sp. TS71-3]